MDALRDLSRARSGDDGLHRSSADSSRNPHIRRRDGASLVVDRAELTASTRAQIGFNFPVPDARLMATNVSMMGLVGLNPSNRPTPIATRL